MDSTILATSNSTTPVEFKNKKYESASEALQAYILDYEGRQSYSERHRKYDKQLIDLLCPKNLNTSNSAKYRKSTSNPSTIKKLVQSAFEKIKKDEEDSVQRSLSASMQLMKKIEKDRLPSPTRFASASSSRESVDTDILLNETSTNSKFTKKMPTVSSKTFSGHNLPFTSPQTSYFKSNSQIPIPTKTEYLPKLSSQAHAEQFDIGHHVTQSSQHVHNNVAGHREKGRQTSEHSLGTSGAKRIRPSPQKTDISKLSHNASYLNKSLDSATWQHPDLMSMSHLRKIKSKFSEDIPPSSAIRNGTDKSGDTSHLKYNFMGESHNTSSSMRTPEKQFHQAASKSNSMNDINASFQDMNATLRSFNTSIERGSNSRERVYGNCRSVSPLRLDSDNLTSSNIEGYELNASPHQQRLNQFDSDITSSSIITGHTMKGALPHHPGINKVSSTPKRSERGRNPQQKRFDSYNTKSSSIDINDITDIPPQNLPYTTSVQEDAVLVSQKQPSSYRPASPMTANGKKDIVGILKGTSPGKARRAMSRVSFTTDDLLDCDPAGLEEMTSHFRPGSKSLTRPLFGSPPIVDLRLTSSSPNSQNLKVSFDERLNRSFNNNNSLHNPFIKEMGKGASPTVVRQREQVYEGLNDSIRSDSNQQHLKYREFLHSLMKEIDDGESSVATTTGSAQYPVPPETNNQGCGFLSRIQSLLASERVPTVSQYLDSDDSKQGEADSLTTEAVLEGDRPWENTHSFKPPVEVGVSEDDKPKTMFEKFMDDCMVEAQGGDNAAVHGPSQPGSLEALKNMLFTIQGLSTSHTSSQGEEAQSKLDPHYEAALLGEAGGNDPDLTLDDSISKLLSPETRKLLSTSYSKQPGGPSLEKAMEHLTKLRGLMENNEQQYDEISDQ